MCVDICSIFIIVSDVYEIRERSLVVLLCSPGKEILYNSSRLLCSVWLQLTVARYIVVLVLFNKMNMSLSQIIVYILQ